MSEGTEGVLLRSADGGHYFIPQTDLAQYEVGGAGEAFRGLVQQSRCGGHQGGHYWAP